MDINDNILLIIEDIRLKYENYRKNGHSRDTAISLIRKEYVCELRDDDDRIAVLIGMVFALCKKKELLEAIAEETRAEIRRIKRYCLSSNDTHTYFSNIEEKMSNPDVYGDEASYTRSNKYSPNWKIGDTFAHVITYPAAEKLGIMGWFILLCKVGDYIHPDGRSRQLMCISLCPPDSIPSTPDDFHKLSFIPVMQSGEKCEYLTQITIKSKSDESSYDLEKIGCFIDSKTSLQGSYKEECPLTAMPLFGKLKRDDLWPSYEDQICRFYKQYKKIACFRQ